MHKTEWTKSGEKPLYAIALFSSVQLPMVPSDSAFVTPHCACASRGLCDRLVSIYMYVYTYVCDLKKSLNGTSVVDSPFQTLVVDFSSNL